MKKFTVKFCGGCNPKYERGDAYQKIRNAVSDIGTFSLPADGVHYDALVIITGCTACEYDYVESIDADLRIRCTSEAEIPSVIEQLRT